jgi:uncharacterized protein YaaN involved in tellurite resistance
LQVLDRAALEVDRLTEALRREDERLSARLRLLRRLEDRAERLARSLVGQIAEGEARLAEIGADPAPDREIRNALDRRLHDLRLTQTVRNGAVLSIRSAIVADELVSLKVTALRSHVLPVWQAQAAPLLAMAQAAPGRRLSSGCLDLLRAASSRLSGGPFRRP